jgi:outer membrane protein
LVFAIGACSQKEKTAYILNQKLFDEFQGTIELQKKLKKTEDQQKFMLDSLSLELKLLAGKGDPKSKAIYAQRQMYANKVYSEIMSSNREMVTKHEADLWKQINQYVSEYGKQNGYTYIFGTSGEGSLMYADTTNNITPDLIKYINQKYAGK